MRNFRMIATPVLLLALLGLLIWGASWGWRNLTAPLPSPSPTPCVTIEASVVTPDLVTVRVFNGGFTSGLAGRVREYLEGHQFNVAKVENTEERVAETVIRGNADDQAALELVQSHFVGAVIEHDNRVDGSVDVLVGTVYEGTTDEPLTQVEAPGGVVCEYQSASAQASPGASETAAREEGDAPADGESSPEPSPTE